MADVLDQLRSELSDRYTIVRELGAGGMATVYLAHDVRHDRDVALKVLLPDLAGALGAERFLTEIKLCARLQHPHILTVLDSGETAGLLWFTMPFVEGESLRDRLNREKQLAVDEAVRIAREAAEALDYAHRHGVVHRDIKPENILLSDGHALVADFGIGRALTAGEQRLTATGLSVGTPAYMSPEQAAGDRDVDARSDVYSLAIVLYEMLGGETPFSAPTSQAMIARRFTETARPIRQIRDSVPEHVEAAVAKALSRTAADRYATAGEFGRALAPAATMAAPVRPPTTSQTTAARKTRRRLSPALTTLTLGFLIGVGVLFAWRSRDASRDDEASARAIAVLPFENVGDAADEYFADGVADEVRGKLSALPGLRVIAGTSMREYKKSTKTVAQIARELGVSYVLVGKVRWAKAPDGTSRVQVRPELVQVAGAMPTTRWEQPFDASLTDVFKVQADIAAKVASALNVQLGDSTQHTLAAAPTANLAAYDAFLKGEAASQEVSVQDALSLRRAAGFYEQAVELDPKFARAWSRLARVRGSLYANSTPTPQLAQSVREAADHAQALAPGTADAALAAWVYRHSVVVDNAQALAALQAGLRTAPNDADLLGATATGESAQGAWDSAYVHLKHLRMLDPRSVINARRLATNLLFRRQYDEAAAVLDSARLLSPTNVVLVDLRVIASLGQGKLADAQAVVRSATAPDPAALIAALGQYYDLYWVLDPQQQDLLLSFPASAFDNDRALLAIVRAQTYYVRGDQAHARAYADTAQVEFARHIHDAPGDGQQHVIRGLALAYAGRKSEAIQEGLRGVELLPVSRDANTGPYMQHQLARIYALVGEPDKAVDVLTALLKTPYYVSPAFLRIDPEFAMLKGNPRFERLIGGQ